MYLLNRQSDFQVSYHFGNLRMSAFFLTFKKGTFLSSIANRRKRGLYLSLNRTFEWLLTGVNSFVALHIP